MHRHLSQKSLWLFGGKEKKRRGESNMELHFLVTKIYSHLLRQEGHRRLLLSLFPTPWVLKSTQSKCRELRG
jgi:hypothetical protein